MDVCDTPRWQVMEALHLMGDLRDVIKDTHGNVSQRDGDVLYIKPSGMQYNSIMLDDVCQFHIPRAVSLENKRIPSIDSVHHRRIYKNHSWIGGICHTHSPYATAFAAAERHLNVYTTEHADFFGSYVRCFPYADMDNWSRFELYADEKAVLLGGHGVLTFGNNAKEAVQLAAALENIAQKNYLIETLRPSILQRGDLPREEIQKWHTRYNTVYGQKKNDSTG